MLDVFLANAALRLDDAFCLVVDEWGHEVRHVRKQSVVSQMRFGFDLADLLGFLLHEVLRHGLNRTKLLHFSFVFDGWK